MSVLLLFTESSRISILSWMNLRRFWNKQGTKDMAVKTGTKTGQGSLSKEQMETAARARKPVDTANKFRLGFLFIGVVALLFIYFGNKLWLL